MLVSQTTLLLLKAETSKIPEDCNFILIAPEHRPIFVDHRPARSHYQNKAVRFPPLVWTLSIPPDLSRSLPEERVWN